MTVMYSGSLAVGSSSSSYLSKASMSWGDDVIIGRRATDHASMSKYALRRAEEAARTPPVKMRGDGTEEEDISFVSSFKYLGFHFGNGGDLWRHVQIRMAQAASSYVSNSQVNRFRAS